MTYLHFINYFTYIILFLILLYQFNFGIKGLIYKEDHLKGFQFFLFLFFLSTEISRSFFPIYVSSFNINLENNIKNSLPQLFWGLGLFLSSLYAWRLSKKMSILKILKYCCLIKFISIFAMSVTDLYVVMVIFRVINSICFGIVSYLAVLYLVNISTNAITMKYFLYAVSFSCIAGSALTGFLSAHFSYSYILMGSSFVALIAYFLLDFCFEHKYDLAKENHSSKTSQNMLFNFNLQFASLITILPYRFLLVGFFYFFVPLYMYSLNYSIDKIGQSFMIFFIIDTLCLSPISSLIDKYKISKHLLLFSLCIISISLFGLYYYANNYLLLLFFVSLLSFGMTINNCLQIPIIPLILKNECHTFGHSDVLAYTRTIDKLGSLVGSLVIAVLYKAFNSQVILILGYTVFVLFILQILYFIKIKYYKPSHAQQQNTSNNNNNNDLVLDS